MGGLGGERLPAIERRSGLVAVAAKIDRADAGRLGDHRGRRTNGLVEPRRAFVDLLIGIAALAIIEHERVFPVRVVASSREVCVLCTLKIISHATPQRRYDLFFRPLVLMLLWFHVFSSRPIYIEYSD